MDTFVGHNRSYENDVSSQHDIGNCGEEPRNRDQECAESDQHNQANYRATEKEDLWRLPGRRDSRLCSGTHGF